MNEVTRAYFAKAGAVHDFVIVKGAGHSFDWERWNGKPLSRDLRPVALAFLEKHLGR